MSGSKIEQDAKRYRHLKRKMHRQNLQWSNNKYKFWVAVFADYANIDRAIDEDMERKK